MLRCALVATLATALAWPHAATAQVVQPRSFSAQTLRGTLQVTQPPEVLLNGQPARLSPGSRIRGTNNLLIMSGAIVGEQLLVHYTLDGLGNVHLVWVLTPAEAARQPWPVSLDEAQRWEFNPSEQTWTRR